MSYLPFYIIPRFIWDRCPISCWKSNTFSWNECGCCQEMGALGLFALWGIVSYWKRYQISLLAQIGCFGVEYRFKRYWKKINDELRLYFSPSHKKQWRMTTHCESKFTKNVNSSMHTQNKSTHLSHATTKSFCDIVHIGVNTYVQVVIRWVSMYRKHILWQVLRRWQPLVNEYIYYILCRLKW